MGIRVRGGGISILMNKGETSIHLVEAIVIILANTANWWNFGEEGRNNGKWSKRMKTGEHREEIRKSRAIK